MHEVTRDGRTVIFVSHNLAAVQSLCDRGLLLDGGHIVFEGTVNDTIEHYLKSIADDVAGLRPRARGSPRQRRPSLHGRGRGRHRRRSGARRWRRRVRARLRVRRPSRGIFSSRSPSPDHSASRCSCARTSCRGDNLAAAPAVGTFRCTIRSSRSSPGRYSLNVFAKINGVIADWIEHAAFFEVIESDVFGTGRLPALVARAARPAAFVVGGERRARMPPRRHPPRTARPGGEGRRSGAASRRSASCGLGGSRKPTRASGRSRTRVATTAATSSALESSGIIRYR